jgi:hypothetical protein
VAFVTAPAEVKAELQEVLDSCRSAKTGEIGFAMVFVKSRTELLKQFSPYVVRLAPAGMLWIAWPKKTSGLATDLNENDVRRIGLQSGLVDVKVCAVNNLWSALKFVIRLKDR